MTGSIENYRVTPIDRETVAEVRRTMAAPGYGHPAHAEVADTPAPCRYCLQDIQPGEKRLLFTYNSFAGIEDYPLPGPVYIHADDCEPHDEPGQFPPAWRSKWLAFHAYSKGRQQITDGRSLDGDPDWVLDTLFADPRVEYVQVHSLTAGCFLFRVNRHRSIGHGRSHRDADARG